MSGSCAPALASEVRPMIDNSDNLQELSINAQVPRFKSRLESQNPV
jgi:hypothetical protein